MSIFAYNRFVSSLALVALVTGVLLFIPAIRRRAALFGNAGLWLAWLVATSSTVGSLVYSEVYHLEPCRLCWYQRIAMYPLALMLGIAVWKRDGSVRRYALPLAAVGAAIAAYHYALQTFPGLDTGACSAGVPCTAKYVNEFGFVSIPFMALAGFVAVIGLVSVKGERDVG
jgi:hypothetical protein